MSLLLQALQKAAKNREATQQNPEVTTGFATSSGSTLELEPGEIEPPAPRPREFDPSVEATRARTVRESTPEPSADQAAIVVGATGIAKEPGFNVVDWARDHPVHIFAVMAATFLTLYFAYVLIEIRYPGFWTRSGSITGPTTPPASPLGRRTQQGTTTLGSAPADASAPMPDLLPPPPAGQAAESTGVVAQGSVSQVPAPATVSSPPPAATVDVVPAEPPSISAPPSAPAPAPPQVKQAKATDDASALPAPRTESRVSAQNSAPRSTAAKRGSVPNQGRLVVKATDLGAGLNAQLTEAYELLQKGETQQSQTAYERVLANDGRNVDAMLGLASIAWQEGHTEKAAEHYSRILQLDPHNAAAQSGLIGLLGRVDPTASETRLKQLIAREASGALYFALGNLYASQRLWAQAQQSYFQSFQMEPTNPDYAFNLAVGLEHLGQRKLALEYYRKALDLSFARGRAGFDQKRVITRIGELSLANE